MALPSTELTCVIRLIGNLAAVLDPALPWLVPSPRSREGPFAADDAPMAHIPVAGIRSLAATVDPSRRLRGRSGSRRWSAHSSAHCPSRPSSRSAAAAAPTPGAAGATARRCDGAGRTPVGPKDSDCTPGGVISASGRRLPDVILGPALCLPGLRGPERWVDSESVGLGSQRSCPLIPLYACGPRCACVVYRGSRRNVGRRDGREATHAGPDAASLLWGSEEVGRRCVDPASKPSVLSCRTLVGA